MKDRRRLFHTPRERSVRRVLMLVAFVVPCLPVAAIREQEAKGDTVVMQEVVVTVSRPRLVDGSSPGQVIGRRMIETLPSSSVADALKYMAGVQVKDYGGLGGQKTVNVRSLGSQHVGVYIDGVRVTNAQNGTVDLGKYSLATLESVSLFNANKSEPLMMASEYASAATVYLRTRKPERRELAASGGWGSFGTWRGAVNYTFAPRSNRGEQDASSLNRGEQDAGSLNRGEQEAGSLNRGGLEAGAQKARRGVAGFIDGAFTSTKGNYPFRYHTQWEDTTGTRRNSDIRMMRVESCLFWRGMEWHTYYFDSERGLPGGIVRRLSDTYTDVGREWDRNFFSQLSYKRNFGVKKGSIGVRAIGKYANDWLHYRSDYPENISVHANNKYHQQDIYAAGAGAYTLPLSANAGELKFSASTDLRWSDLTTDVKNFSYVWRLDSKTSLSAFYSRKGLHLNASGLYTRVTDHTRDTAKPLSRFTYNALASYTLPLESRYGELAVRTFYKSVFRAPTLNDLYYTLVGNRNLRPEYTRQLDAGLTYSMPIRQGWGLDLQTDFYYNRVEDRIVCLPLKGSYQWTMLNYGHTRCLGVNLSANLRYRQHSLLLTGTWQDDRDRTSPGEDSYNDYIAYSPRWSATAVYTFLYKGWSASLSHMFVDRRYWTAENAIEAPLAAYNCTDVKVGYCFRLKRSPSLTLEAECQNLFDTRYEIIQRWPMPGRRYALTVKMRI